MESIKIKKYPAYKPSGVEWLGEIPEHWELTRLGKILFPNSKRNQPELPLLSITRGKGVILRDIDNEEENHNYIPDDLTNYKILGEGQFGMNKMKAWQGSYGISDYTGIVSPAYFVFELIEIIEPRYFHIAIRSKLYISFFGSASDGVRIGQWDLSKERMKQIPFLIPSKEEQTAIAAFLDRKTALIDQAIAIKEKQIELLRERRQILIHRAVTRGLNPNVKFKESGVEWIGEIPEHWKVQRFKHFTKILSGYSPEQVKFTEEPKIDYFKVDDLNNVDENYRLSNSNWFVENFKLAKIYSKNILLIPKRGGAIGTNKIAITTTSCIFDTNVMGLEFDLLKVDIDLIAIWLKSRNLITIADTTTIPQINNKHIYPLVIALPELKEQFVIIEYIKKSSNKLATAISLKEQEIEKLKEYKASLIDAVVTGKIKVN